MPPTELVKYRDYFSGVMRNEVPFNSLELEFGLKNPYDTLFF